MNLQPRACFLRLIFLSITIYFSSVNDSSLFFFLSSPIASYIIQNKNEIIKFNVIVCTQPKVFYINIISEPWRGEVDVDIAKIILHLNQNGSEKYIQYLSE